MQSETLFRFSPFSKSRPALPALASKVKQDGAPSAARLAAELAFSRPSLPLPPAEQPRVVVRKAKMLLMDANAGPVQHTEQPPFAGEIKRPRVFQIGRFVHSNVDSAVADRANQAARVDFRQAPRPRPAKRLGIDRLPGPLVELFRSAAEPQPNGMPGVVQPPTLTLPQINDLIEKLAGLQTVLDSIASAQLHQPTDSAPNGEWCRLSDTADGIQRQIDSQLI